MGKISLSGRVAEEQQPVKKNIILPVLTKKEWITFVSYSICLSTIGIFIGYLLFKDIKTINSLDILHNELNNKLQITSKQLNKIDDEDLYKVVMEKKGKKIEEIKEQLNDIEQFKIKQSNEVVQFVNNKKDELKKKEIIVEREAQMDLLLKNLQEIKEKIKIIKKIFPPQN